MKNLFLQKNRKGMTIVELMISIFILTLIIMVSVSVATSYLKGRTKIKKFQSNIEEMSLTLNSLAKELRMSNCDNATYCDLPSSESDKSSIKLISNAGSQTEGVTYSFSGGNLNRQIGGNSPEVMLSNVAGTFHVAPGATVSCISGCVSSNCCFSNRVNRITITLRRNDQTSVILETTVSMRGGYNGY